jgi:segregation and condensation protein A
MYEIKLEKFSGPLEKLLELIEERKLKINEISLAAVTADFLKYVKTLSEVRPQILADFVAVAAKLLLIKSKTLLPDFELTHEEEIEIKDLEARLKIYREFKLASQNIKKLWDKNNISFSRPLLMVIGEANNFFYPSANLTISNLAKAISNLTSALKEFFLEPQKIKSVIIPIEQKMKSILVRLESAAHQNFQELSKSRPRPEIIVLFLAILHLLKDQMVQVEQNSQFGDIIINKMQNNN